MSTRSVTAARAVCIRAVAALALIGCGLRPASAFELKVTNPDFTVTVPNLPDLRLQPPATRAAGATRTLVDDGDYRVTAGLKEAASPVSARECAGTGLRAILAQPGMPGRDNVYRAALSATTFLVLYVQTDDRRTMLHAHLLSAVAGTHCADVHFIRPGRRGEDHEEWRNAFTGARIDDGAK
jgi:hypothetical protein